MKRMFQKYVEQYYGMTQQNKIERERERDYLIRMKLHLRPGLEYNSIVFFTKFHEVDISATQKDHWLVLLADM